MKLPICLLFFTLAFVEITYGFGEESKIIEEFNYQDYNVAKTNLIDNKEQETGIKYQKINVVETSIIHIWLRPMSKYHVSI